MLNPFIHLITSVISIYTFCLIAWVILSLLISFNIINRFQPFVQKVMYALDRLCEPALKPIRRYMPDLGGLDLSPVVLLLLLNFLSEALIRYLYNL